MKLSFLLIFFTLVQASATSFSQTINLDVNNAEIRQVIKDIEQQTDYRFFYTDGLTDLARKVSLNIKGQNIDIILSELFDDTQLGYRIVDHKLVMLAPKGAMQQGTAITGTVTDETGEAMPGVNITVKGAAIGVVTDVNGKFSINVPNTDAVLAFSFIGYATQEITVGNQSSINVTLNEDTRELEEVVVVGYGTMRKKDLTGAIASISGDDVAARKTTQLSQALQGAIPGVLVTRDNNAPGSTSTIRVRGITTIGDSNPLIIVDGMQVDNINDINPNDIENISVLKDAASSSIYGSQAAAGVILITTKRAKADHFSLEYNFEYGMEIPTQNPEYVDVIRFMQMTNELRWNDAGNVAGGEYPTYAKDVIDNYYQLNRDNPDKYPNTDWMKLMMKSNVPRQSHVIKISGGTKAIRTAASFAYDNIGSLYTVGDRTYERITSRINNDLTINKFLAASIDVSFKRTIDKQPYVDPMNYTRLSPPVYAALWKDGRLADGKTGDNIYGRVRDGGYRHSWYNQLGAKIGLDFTPIDGLKISGNFSPVFNSTKQKQWQTVVPWYLSDDPTVRGGFIVPATNLSEVRNDNYRLTTQFLANYSKNFENHSFDLMAGYENRYEFNENLGASRRNYELDSYPYLNIGPQELRGNSGTAREYARRSFFGRIMYHYNNKYLLQANLRYDASSRFADGYRWGAFPSVSAGWVISEESFLQNVKALSFLKLRASWGTLGNERIGDFPYLSTIEFANAFLFQGNNVTSQQAAAQVKYAINDITWETTESYDIGVDAYFLNNRLRFTGDYYKKKTRDMLLALQIPTFMGFDNPDQNTGKMHTTGWEISVGWNDRIGEIGYSIDLNISDFKSVMGDLGGTEFLGSQIKIEGSEFNEWYGYRSQGIYQTQDEVTNSATISTSTKAGDVRYQDVNGANGSPDNLISPEYDRVLLGGSQPRFTYGGNIRFDYKNFDFGIFFQGVGKQNSRLDPAIIQPLRGNWGNISSLLDGNIYSHYNTAEQNLAAKYPRLTYSNPGSNYAMSDFWMFNGRYFRLKNISLGYTFPQKWINKIALQNLRIYANVSDLFCLSKYPKGWDPEMEAESAYPITTSVIFGISVKF